MARLLLVLAPVLLVALAPAPAAPVPKRLIKPGPELYYPTRVGTKWIEENDRVEIEAVVSKRKEKDGAIHVTVEHTLKKTGEHRFTLIIAVSEKGVFRIGVDAHIDNPPVCWLKLPSKPGDEWHSFGFHLVASAPEEIEVPAGKFRAIPVAMYRGRILGLPCDSTRWFAPGVGLIRQGDDERNTLVMKSFTPAKD